MEEDELELVTVLLAATGGRGGSTMSPRPRAGAGAKGGGSSFVPPNLNRSPGIIEPIKK